MMRKVRLETSDGGFVTMGVVPRFMPGLEPKVILWGQRVFGRYLDPAHESDPMVYREVFAVAMVQTLTDDGEYMKAGPFNPEEAGIQS